MNVQPVDVRIVDHGVETAGPIGVTSLRLRFDLDDLSLAGEGACLLQMLAAYFATAKPLAPGQKIDWASSLLIARQHLPDCISFGDLAFDGETVIPVVDNAVRLWIEQSTLCKASNVDLCPARFGQMIAISPSVQDSSQPLEGIRYEVTDTMSGWWLFTSDYDGRPDDFRSMTPTHTFHVLHSRPDVAKFLGLPHGFAFQQEPVERVWREAQ